MKQREADVGDYRGTPRLIDVATASGVSIATASRALTGKTGVSTTLALHVQQVAADLGYVPNVHARSLAGGSVASLGLVVHEIQDPYFSEIASGVLRLAGEHGRSVQISHAERTPESELAQVRLMRSHRVGALIVVGSGYMDPRLELPLALELSDFENAGGRAAVIGRHNLPVDAVLPDNEAAGHALGLHLRQLGHTSIGLVSGPNRLNTISDRTAGVARALRETGVDSAHLGTAFGPFTRQGGVEGTRQLLARHPETTAIVALNDAMAVGVLHSLRSLGISVPSQISVASFDDISMAADVAPSLTTVRLPLVDMGAQAVKLILMPRASRPRRKRTGHELVVRDSTGPVRVGA